VLSRVALGVADDEMAGFLAHPMRPAQHHEQVPPAVIRLHVRVFDADLANPPGESPSHRLRGMGLGLAAATGSRLLID